MRQSYGGITGGVAQTVVEIETRLPTPAPEPDDPSWRSRLAELFGGKAVSDLVAQHGTYQRLSDQLAVLEEERAALTTRYHECVDVGRSPQNIEKQIKSVDEKVVAQRHHLSVLRGILGDHLPGLAGELKTAVDGLYAQVSVEQQEQVARTTASLDTALAETLPPMLQAEAGLARPREFFRPVQDTLRAGDLDSIVALMKEIKSG
jgi:hypothetical protein